MIPVLQTDTLGVWNELETTNFIDDTVRFNPAAGEIEQLYTTAVALARPMGDREQKIVILGDADCISNVELFKSREEIESGNFYIILGSFAWLSDGEAPVDVRRPKSIDNHLFLEKMGVPMYKIASFEINDIPLIRYVAQKRKPMIISTGLGDIQDIESAIDACKAAGNDDITLLKCTSQYPATLEQANLITIPDMAARFKVKVGVSDHTMGDMVPVVAVSLGARVVEKHFILDRALGGPDAAFSVEPQEFERMIKAIRDVELALGTVKYEVTDKDKMKRRSLFVTQDISKGDILGADNIRSLRPGYGLAPVYLSSVYGKNVNRDLKKGDALRWEYID